MLKKKNPTKKKGRNILEHCRNHQCCCKEHKVFAVLFQKQFLSETRTGI